jgi:Glyoxalase-like domain
VLRGIDHIVVVVPDLAAAIKNYTDLGFTVTTGGRHPIGSENALIPFEDGSYIELIAFTVSDSGLFWQDRLQEGGGIVDFCARCESLTQSAELLRKAGAAIADPMPLSRTRPDGCVVKWLLAMPQPPWAGIIPFLIEDLTPRSERVPSATHHANGVIGIDTITLVVTDASRLSGFYETVLGERSKPIHLPELQATGFCVHIGPQRCALVSPTSDLGAVAEWLKSRGPSLYSAALKTAHRPLRNLDMNKTENAKLSLV